MWIPRILLAGSLLAATSAAAAGSLSITPTVASDYDWRSFSQTDPDQDGKPALQLGATWSFDSGLYVGAWGSNVDFGSPKPDVELDAFAGYVWGDSDEGLGFDVGVNFYNYPGASAANFYEIYAGIAGKYAAGKLWYAPKFGGDGGDSAFYLEASTTIPLPAGFSLLGHAGYSVGDGIESYYYANGFDACFDYSLGVGYALDRFDLAVRWIANDSPGNDGRVVASVSTTLPWSE